LRLLEPMLHCKRAGSLSVKEGFARLTGAAEGKLNPLHLEDILFLCQRLVGINFFGDFTEQFIMTMHQFRRIWLRLRR